MIHFLFLIVACQFLSAISVIFYRLAEEKRKTVFKVVWITSSILCFVTGVLVILTLFGHKRVVEKKEIAETNGVYKIAEICPNGRKSCTYLVDMNDGTTSFRYIDGGKAVSSSAPTDAVKTLSGNMDGEAFVKVVTTTYQIKKAWYYFYIPEIITENSYEFYIPQS